MNGTYTFILELTLTLQVLIKLRGREREKEKYFFCPKKCPKRNLLKTKFLLMGKKSKVPLSVRNESK